MVVFQYFEDIDRSGCCYDECPLNCMTACAEGHLFCLDCGRRNAETIVGNGGHIFRCMDVSGCKAEFPAAEIVRFVDAKTIALRDKLASGDAIREVPCFPFFCLTQASIEGFVTCPFCDYGAIVEDENDKEFRCQKKECEIVSCRLCRSESHIPLSCEEHQKENRLSAKHLVEEAMSAALISKCNKCSKPFVKISGCNKMICSCGNRQCYVCGENIQDYSHFDRPRDDGTKCVLHESDESRLQRKIMNAQEKAMKKVLEEEKGLKEEDVKVEAPKPPAPVQVTNQGWPQMPGLQFVQQLMPQNGNLGAILAAHAMRRVVSFPDSSNFRFQYKILPSSTFPDGIRSQSPNLLSYQFMEVKVTNKYSHDTFISLLNLSFLNRSLLNLSLLKVVSSKYMFRHTFIPLFSDRRP